MKGAFVYMFKKYFSKWFKIIPKSLAQQLWKENRSFVVLANDGSDRDAGNFANFEEIEKSYPDALFGLEK